MRGKLYIILLWLCAGSALARPAGRPRRSDLFNPAPYLQAKTADPNPYALSNLELKSPPASPPGFRGVHCRADEAPAPALKSCSVGDLSCLGAPDRPYILRAERPTRTPETSDLAEQLFSHMRDNCWVGKASGTPKAGFRPELDLSLNERKRISASVGVSGYF